MVVNKVRTPFWRAALFPSCRQGNVLIATVAAGGVLGWWLGYRD